MPDAPTLLPDLIRRYREMRGWTQTDLAYHAGCHQPAISAYETGARQPQRGRLDRIVKALGIPRDELAPSLPSSAGRSAPAGSAQTKAAT